MDQVKIGKLIKEIRIKNKLTQKQFADKYGVTYQAVSKWENGKSIPDVALLKEISKDFNIDINDILEGEYVFKSSKKKYFLIAFVVFLVLGTIYLIVNKQDNFSFKTLSSQCSSFNITGSIAYNDSKSSIYISNIDYCGKKDDKKYFKIECTLFEKNDVKNKAISKYVYDEKKGITLDKYLKTLNIKIDDYKSTCKKYTKDSLYLIITANDKAGVIKKYHVPLSLNDNC